MKKEEEIPLNKRKRKSKTNWNEFKFEAKNLLTREEFVKLCHKAILSTRDKVVPVNQKSGYKKYHGAEKDERYVDSKLRPENSKINTTVVEKAKRIKQGGVGRCQEMGEFLAYSITKRLIKLGVEAKINIVNSNKVDHVYLRISIALEGERKKTLWEVDAWDPRIIDCAKSQYLTAYGLYPNLQTSFSTLQQLIHLKKYHDKSSVQKRLKKFPSAKKGLPNNEDNNAPPTPPHEMTTKHKWLYDDYTIEESVKNGTFPPGKPNEQNYSLGMTQRPDNSGETDYNEFLSQQFEEYGISLMGSFFAPSPPLPRVIQQDQQQTVFSQEFNGESNDVGIEGQWGSFYDDPFKLPNL